MWIYGGKWGFIDVQGNVVIPPQFDEVKPFSSGTSEVWSVAAGKLGLIDRKGALILPYEFKSIEPFHEGLAAVRGPDGPGYIRPDGSVAIRAAGWDFGSYYQGFGTFIGGLALVHQGDYKAGYIDKTGRIAIPIQFEYARDFSEGLAPVQAGGRWGYIDTRGTMVIPPNYADAMPFVDGLAMVKTGSIWSYIDTRGVTVFTDVFREE